jgi:hypothetical protein
MKEHTPSTGFMIAILASLLMLPVGWAQQLKPGVPYLARIELRIMKEGVTRVTALRTGEWPLIPSYMG